VGTAATARWVGDALCAAAICACKLGNASGATSGRNVGSAFSSATAATAGGMGFSFVAAAAINHSLGRISGATAGSMGFSFVAAATGSMGSSRNALCRWWAAMGCPSRPTASGSAGWLGTGAGRSFTVPAAERTCLEYAQ